MSLKNAQNNLNLYLTFFFHKTEISFKVIYIKLKLYVIYDSRKV